MGNEQPNPIQHTPQAAIGLSVAMGCYIFVLAVASIAVGLLIDQALGTDKRIATVVCAMVGLPINLITALWITMQIIKRIVPQSKPKLTAAKGEPVAGESASGETAH